MGGLQRGGDRGHGVGMEDPESWHLLRVLGRVPPLKWEPPTHGYPLGELFRGLLGGKSCSESTRPGNGQGAVVFPISVTIVAFSIKSKQRFLKNPNVMFFLLVVLFEI